MARPDKSEPVSAVPGMIGGESPSKGSVVNETW